MSVSVRYYFDVCFFKQKTAYEMRISDWSSDVCSSDLLALGGLLLVDHRLQVGRFLLRVGHCGRRQLAEHLVDRFGRLGRVVVERVGGVGLEAQHLRLLGAQLEHLRDDAGVVVLVAAAVAAHRRLRSEEHTSELQSLMRNSYAVFCLKKKN